MLPVDLVPGTFQGLPTHALIVHATVVALPLTAVALLLSAFSARARARFGIFLPLAGIVSLVLIPLTTMSGEDLKAHVYFPGPVGQAILRHQRAAGHLLPWTIAMAVMCIAVYVVGRFGPRKTARSVGAATMAPAPRSELAGRSAAAIVVAVLATVAAVGTGVQVSFVGHLGAEAVWHGYSQLPVQKNVPDS
jgi:hypothetical protein